MSQFTNFTATPSAPATYETGAKKGETRTTTVILPNVPLGSVALPRTTAKIKGNQTEVHVVEIPSAEISIPQYDSWDAFASDASVAGSDPFKIALDSVNAQLKVLAARHVRAAGAAAKTFTDYASLLSNVIADTLHSFFIGTTKKESAKSLNDRVAAIAADDSLSAEEQLAAIKAMLRNAGAL